MITEVLSRIASADPAAGAEVAYTATTALRLVAVSVQLVQGLTQTPLPILTIDDGVNVVYRAPADTTAQPVSTTQNYTWGVGLPLIARTGATPNVYSFGPLPDNLVLLAGWRVRTVTLGAGANTDFGVATLLADDYGS